MKNLILVAVILPLVVTIIEINGEYKFGDIIMFPRARLTKKAKPLYKHYAIYVGPKTVIDVGQGDNDIFHRTGRTKRKSICEFGKLEKIRGRWGDQKDNYLDELLDSESRSRENIIKRIIETAGQCQKYKVLTNNCEHLATYVRYGLRISLQRGSIAGIFFNNKISLSRRRKIIYRIRVHQAGRR